MKAEQPTLYVCENCGLLAPITAFSDDCAPGWTHGRLIKVQSVTAVSRELVVALTPHLARPCEPRTEEEG